MSNSKLGDQVSKSLSRQTIISLIIVAGLIAFATVSAASEQVALGAGQMAESAQGLAEGATEQAGAVEELTATIEDVTQAVSDSAQTANESYNRAKEFERHAQESNDGTFTNKGDGLQKKSIGNRRKKKHEVGQKPNFVLFVVYQTW